MLEKRIRNLDKYNNIRYNHLKCYYNGFIYKSGFMSGEESIEEFLKDYCFTKSVNLDGFYGSYRIIIEDINEGELIFMGDNSGSCCFYYDNNTMNFSESFIDITTRANNLIPNYNSITEFLSFNCIYSDEMICKDIYRTNPSEYYIIKDKKLLKKEKSFLSVSNRNRYKSLSEFIDDFVKASKNTRKAAVITGGTDSRTILSHLVSKNVDFDLFISGKEESEDVKIAKEISFKLNKKLYISDDDIKNIDVDRDELKKLFMSTDGVYSLLSKHRLYRKNYMLNELGAEIEIGGISGELYKNSFLNQDFPLYNLGTVNKTKFYKMKINPDNFNEEFFTNNINIVKKSMKERILKNLFIDISNKKYNTYFNAGIKALQYRMITVTNSSSFNTPIFSPLAEIDVMALSYNLKPWKLELNKWQRYEVSRYCPQIAKIKTDRGTTLDYNLTSLSREFIGTYAYLIKVGIARIFRTRNSSENIKKIEGLYKIKANEISLKAVNKCKELEILKKDVEVELIPDILLDRILTIAMIFSPKDYFD